VLSGADGDGAIGIRRIKERGGLSIAQDPHEAEHSSMPRSAIATGVVDLVLPVAEMAARLVTYHRLERQLELPLVDESGLAAPANGDGSGATLSQVLELMRNRTGHDFEAYKRATVLRRLARRMQVNEDVTLPDYLEVLRTRPAEARRAVERTAGQRDQFLPRRRSLHALEALIRRCSKAVRRTDTVRGLGCRAVRPARKPIRSRSLLQEFAEPPQPLAAPARVRVRPRHRSVRTGSRRLLSPTIAADVSAERLERFFSEEGARLTGSAPAARNGSCSRPTTC
jgi:two-component system CheB/CheR fusion protein